MNTLLRFLLKINPHSPERKDHRDRGMTMIELMVGTVMAFLVMTPLFMFVLNILNSDRREQIKTGTEQDIQATLDYITQDLQQSVYIYDQTGVNALLGRNALPAANVATNGVPVLVFWKRELVKNSIPVYQTSSASYSNCVSSPTKCDDAYVYTLVAYYLRKRSGAKAGDVVRYDFRDCVKSPLDGSLCIRGDATFTTLVPNSRAINGNAIGDTNGNFKPFNLALSGTLQEKMNKWPQQSEAPGETIPTIDTTKFDGQDLVRGTIDFGSTTLGSCPNTIWTKPTGSTYTYQPQLPQNLEGGFFACVDPFTTRAQITLRGNSLVRYDPRNTGTFSAANAAYFPSVSIQVRGIGGLGE